jgi:hypothetical protein
MGNRGLGFGFFVDLGPRCSDIEQGTEKVDYVYRIGVPGPRSAVHEQWGGMSGIDGTGIEVRERYVSMMMS